MSLGRKSYKGWTRSTVGHKILVQHIQQLIYPINLYLTAHFLAVQLHTENHYHAQQKAETLLHKNYVYEENECRQIAPSGHVLWLL